MSFNFKILVLLFAVNGAPIVLNRLLGPRWNTPLDGGLKWLDAKPLFGVSKTWRGTIGALIAGPIAAVCLDFSLISGVLVAAGAMAGDLLSSFVKRRMGIASSGQALGLDQIPESLIPLLILRNDFGLASADIFILVVDFLVLELLISRLLYWLRIRERPY